MIRQFQVSNAVQVDGGHFSNDEDCKAACKQLAVQLGQDQAPAKSSFRVLAGQSYRTFEILSIVP